MATYALPNTETFRLARLRWALRQNVIVNPSPFNGVIERVELPGARWVATIEFPERGAGTDEAADLEAFWQRVGGPANLVQLWHPIRPQPRGTMRGAPTVASAVAQGATVLPIQAAAGVTLKAADMLRAAGMVFMVVTPGVASGSGALSVSVTPPARVPIDAGTLIVWDRPSALFMPTGEIEVPYEGSKQLAFAVELVEVW